MCVLILWDGRYLIEELKYYDIDNDLLIYGPAQYVDIIKWITENMPGLDVTDWSVPDIAEE